MIERTMATRPTYVQSLDGYSAVPVATTVRDYGGGDVSSLAVQHMILAAGSDNVLATVFSAAGSNPVAVALVDAAGALRTSWGVTQAGSPWVTFAGSTGQPQGTSVVSVVGQPTVTASVVGAVTAVVSVAGQATATVSVAGIVTGAGSVYASQAGAWTMTGSVQVTQASSPWVVFPGSTGQPQGTVVASVVGAVSVVASVVGQPTVTASIVGQLTSTVSVAGIPVVYVASIGGGGSTVTGSVYVTQASSPWVTFAGSTGQPQGSVVASCVGQQTVTASLIGQPTVTASVVGQLTSTVSVAGIPSVYVASIGGPVSMVGSVYVTQASSPWITRAGSTGDPQGTVVASVPGQLTATVSVAGVPSFTGSAWVSQATSPWVVFAGSTGQPQGSVVASVVGQVTVTASVVGAVSVVASCVGQVTVTASLVGQPTVTASIAGVVSNVGSVSLIAAPRPQLGSFIGSLGVGSMTTFVVSGLELYSTFRLLAAATSLPGSFSVFVQQGVTSGTWLVGEYVEASSCVAYEFTAMALQAAVTVTKVASASDMRVYVYGAQG